MNKKEKQIRFTDKLNDYQLMLISNKWTFCELGVIRRKLIALALEETTQGGSNAKEKSS